MWRADYSLESPLLPKSPRCRWAACLISTDYSLIGVLQNTMTSALFTDGINHSLAELEIPNEFVPSSLFRGCIVQPPAPPPPPTPRLLCCLMPSCWQIISNTVCQCVKTRANLGPVMVTLSIHRFDPTHGLSMLTVVKDVGFGFAFSAPGQFIWPPVCCY